jgi:hypothetical protein
MQHSQSPHRQFALLQNIIDLADLYPRARRLVLSKDALEYALLFSEPTKRKKVLRQVVHDKNYLGPDLLARRQTALDEIVPEDLNGVELWDWEYDIEMQRVDVPSQIHLERLCWGYTSDPAGIAACAVREYKDKMNNI